MEGSSTLGPGSASPSVQSLSESWPAGVWLNETYVLSGACLKRVAVLIAVMIHGDTEPAKLRNDVPYRRKVADGLVETDQAFLDQVLRVAAGEEVRARLEPTKPV